MTRLAKKLKLLAGMDRTQMSLLLEAGFYMGWARFKLLNTPFVKLAATLGTFMQESAAADDGKHRRELSMIMDALHIMSRNTFWESKCLVRAVAGLKMLERRGISSTLYLGTSKDEHGKLIAHAWLRSGPWYITGAEEMDRFVEVGKFACLPESCLSSAAGKR
ncbi:lasso peptide biosynthesis B2 protein [Paenibacillus sp. CAU 1782]